MARCPGDGAFPSPQNRSEEIARRAPEGQRQGSLSRGLPLQWHRLSSLPWRPQLTGRGGEGPGCLFAGLIPSGLCLGRRLPPGLPDGKRSPSATLRCSVANSDVALQHFSAGGNHLPHSRSCPLCRNSCLLSAVGRPEPWRDSRPAPAPVAKCFLLRLGPAEVLAQNRSGRDWA